MKGIAERYGITPTRFVGIVCASALLLMLLFSVVSRQERIVFNYPYALLIVLVGAALAFFLRDVAKAHVYTVCILLFVSGFLVAEYDNTLLVRTRTMEEFRMVLGEVEYPTINEVFTVTYAVLRNDDVGDHPLATAALLSCADEAGVTITLGVIPARLDAETALLLSGATGHEIATHGYAHEHFNVLSFEEQYALIDAGTALIQHVLDVRPTTFIPPYDSGNADTALACRLLGYDTITDVRNHPSFLLNVINSIYYETCFDPSRHEDLDVLKRSIDDFLESGEEVHVTVLHDWTFLGGDGAIDEGRLSAFREYVAYIRSCGLEVVTLGEYHDRKEDLSRIDIDIHDGAFHIDTLRCTGSHAVNLLLPSGRSYGTIEALMHEEPVRFDESSPAYVLEPGMLYVVRYY